MSKLLRALETALWTMVVIILLGLVFVILVWFVYHGLPGLPAVPRAYAWRVIWGVMGAIVLFMGVLWWWWGRVLKDREDARRYADSEPDK